MLDVTDNSNPDAKEVKTNTIWVNEKTKRIEAVGEPLPLSVDRHDVEKKPPKHGLRAVWPIRTDNSEGGWQLGFDTLKIYLEQGIAKLGAYNKKRDQGRHFVRKLFPFCLVIRQNDGL